MKTFYAIIASVGICVGCESSNRKDDSRPYEDFETAIEAIATVNDIWEASAAAEQIYTGGVPAIVALRGYLDDVRVIPSGFCSRSINSSDITLGQQALWTIQDMIEVGLPKMYDNSFYVLRSGNLEQWLDEREGMSIIELEIEAANAQLLQAKQQMEAGAPYAKDAVTIIEDRLEELIRLIRD
ncbi:MAG: hypothetical protein AAF802_30130 [Planctomycetota bacterium]